MADNNLATLPGYFSSSEEIDFIYDPSTLSLPFYLGFEPFAVGYYAH
jgi:hypothetical protein